jgi:hypothetical protein
MMLSEVAHRYRPAEVQLKVAFEFGTKVNYVHFHQTGTEDMVSRKIVFAPRSFAEGLGSDALSYLAGDQTIGGLKRRIVRR